jgi:ribosomal protein L40E
MAKEPDSDDLEIPPFVNEIGRLFGLSPIQVRWKLLAIQRKWRSTKAELAPASRSFEHQICGECGAVQPHEATKCSSCGERLASPVARFFIGELAARARDDPHLFPDDDVVEGPGLFELGYGAAHRPRRALAAGLLPRAMVAGRDGEFRPYRHLAYLF